MSTAAKMGRNAESKLPVWRNVKPIAYVYPTLASAGANVHLARKLR